MRGGGPAGLGRGRGEHADRPRADRTDDRCQHLRGGPERRRPEQDDRRRGIGRHPVGPRPAAEPVGEPGRAQPLARHRAAEIDRRHPQAGLGRRDQPAGAPPLPLDLHGHVDARPGIERLGPVGAVGLRVAEHQPRHQVVERVGAEDVAPRAGRGPVGDLTLAHPPLARAGLDLEPAEVYGVAVVEIAEPEVAEALPSGVDARRTDVDEHHAVFAADPPGGALDDERGVLVDAEAAPYPGLDHRNHQPAEPAPLDEVLVEHAEWEEAEPLAHQEARLFRVRGDAMDDRLDRRSAEDHRL